MKGRRFISYFLPEKKQISTRHNFFFVFPGIVCWLKSLRLHKYSWVFNNLNYNQIVNLTESNLEGMGITKGARHKLLLSITKLRDRSQMLAELETEIMNGSDLLSALKKLKSVLQTPLQLSAGENLMAQFVKVMGKGLFCITIEALGI